MCLRIYSACFCLEINFFSTQDVQTYIKKKDFVLTLFKWFSVEFYRLNKVVLKSFLLFKINLKHKIVKLSL